MAKSANINVRVDQAVKDRLQEICEKEHRTQAEQIAYWIENYKSDKESGKDA